MGICHRIRVGRVKGRAGGRAGGIAFGASKITQQDAHQLVETAKRRALKIRPKAAKSGIFGRFANIDKCRSEVAGDVISSVSVD